ncbi:MAG: putative cytosol aminopeptidase [Pirellulaceae bacterium]|nr:MAG: putative cytosol aminopeptidase [Pirellulaceae bacterium]
MLVRRASEALAGKELDAILAGCFEDAGLSGVLVELDRALDGGLERLRAGRELPAAVGETLLWYRPPGLACSLLVMVGLGKSSDWGPAPLYRAVAAAARQAARKPRRSVALDTSLVLNDTSVPTAIAAVLAGCQGQDLYRSEKKLFAFEELWLPVGSESDFRTGVILGESVNLARRLVDQPPNVIYPGSFAELAADLCREVGIECDVWDEERLEFERCGALLAVGQGSARPPRLLLMRYRGGPADQPPLALVGKGVTFDSGGLSVKPTEGMKTMKCDMAGAATVVAALHAAARLKLPVNLIGLAGLVENLISGSSYKLGDVLTSRSGKTIEILNTDAEGRLVLADLLDIAVEQGAAALVDVATLTGSCIIALGNHVAGLMGNHEGWCARVAQAARRAGEPVWPLPMYAEYAEQLRSSIADLKNVGEGRAAGAIVAAKFLEEFVRGRPWVHLDVAGPAFLESPKPWCDGATGAFVRTLVEVARQWTGRVEETAG